MKGLFFRSATAALAAALAAGIATATAQPAAAPDAAPAADPALLAALIDEGGPVYRTNCATCHGANGEGGAGTTLANYALLENTGTLVRQIIHGGAYMPPFNTMSDRRIAAVSTYIRNAFGNSFGIVTEEEVAAQR